MAIKIQHIGGENMAYGNTNWGNTDYIDREIAQREQQKGRFGAGSFTGAGNVQDQIDALKKQKARVQWLGGMQQAAQLANNVDPATLAGMLVGNIAGGALARHLNREQHSDAYNQDKTGGFGKQVAAEMAAANSQFGYTTPSYDTSKWGSMADVTQAAVMPVANSDWLEKMGLLGNTSGNSF